MPRKDRLIEPGHYHIINRGVERRDVFLEPEDYEYFFDLLSKLTREHQVTLHVFCLMTNHYHLLIETKLHNLPKAVQFLNDKYAKYFNKKYTRTGHLWQGRYKSYPLFDDSHFWIVAKYIERNPLKAAMVDHIEAYPYQSYFLWNTQNIHKSILDHSMIFDMTFAEYSEYISSDLDPDLIETVYVTPKRVFQDGESKLLKKRLETFFEYDRDINRNDNIKKAYEYGYTRAEISSYLNLSHSTISRIVQ